MPLSLGSLTMKLSGGQYFCINALIVNSVRSCVGLGGKARGFVYDRIRAILSLNRLLQGIYKHGAFPQIYWWSIGHCSRGRTLQLAVLAVRYKMSGAGHTSKMDTLNSCDIHSGQLVAVQSQ